MFQLLFYQLKIIQNYLKSGFKKSINWNKYLSKLSTERTNQYLDYLIDPLFQGLNRIFVSPFENKAQQIRYKRYYLPTVEIKNYNVMINRQNFFDQPVKNNLITYANIQKIATGQGDDYTTGWLLEYIYIINYYKTIAINLSKQQVLDADPKAIKQINYSGNLERQPTMFFITEEAKETVFDFLQGT